MTRYMHESLYGSHSADVQMWIDCEHGRIDLSRITPKSVVAKAVTREIPACFAQLVVMVDGRSLRSPVYLSGFLKGRGASLIRKVDDVAPF